MKTRLIRSLSLINILGLIALLVLPVLYLTPKAEAANLNNVMVRLDRMLTGTATGGTICATPAVAGTTEGRVSVVFPSDFVLNETATNWDTDTTATSSWPSGASAWTTIQSDATSATNATKTVVWTSGDLASNSTWYCFNFTGTNTLTTGAVGTDRVGSVTTQTGASAPIDSANYATAVVNGSSAYDQISVSATVPATFAFSLGANADNLGTLSSSSVTASATGVTGTVSTNAANGWTAWVKSANAALNGTGGTIPTAGTINGSPSALSAGTSGYVLDVNAGSGSPTIAGEYDGTDLSNEGGTLSTSFQQIASTSAPGAANTFTLIERVAISATQAAATDYSDTLTVVAAGQF